MERVQNGTVAVAKPVGPYVALVVGLLISVLFGAGFAITRPDYMSCFIQMVVWGSVIWAIFWFLCGGKRAFEREAPLFWAMFLGAGVIAGWALIGFTQIQARSAAQNLKANFEAYERGEEISSGVSSVGEMGEVERFMLELLKETRQADTAYASEIEGSGAFEALNPSVVRADPTLNDSRARVRRGLEIVDKYAAITTARFDGLDAKIEKLKMLQSRKVEFRREFAVRDKANREKAAMVWSNHRAILQQHSRMVDFLSRPDIHWELQGDQFAFAGGAAKEYNKEVAKLHELVATAEAYENQLAADTKGNLEKFESSGTY